MGGTASVPSTPKPNSKQGGQCHEIFCIQANLNRRTVAHDLLYRIVNEKNAHIIFVSEPNKSLVNNPGWYVDKDFDGAIKVTDRSLPVRRWGSGHGYVYITIAETVMVSCYFSPNISFQEYEKKLNEMDEGIFRQKRKQQKILITGDFNAKAAEWGEKTDPKGTLILEWMAQRNLVSHTKGDVPTFVRGNSRSTLDLTITSMNMVDNLGPVIVEDTENLSDHQYVTFAIHTNQTEIERTAISGRKWNANKVDETKFRRCIAKSGGSESVQNEYLLIELLTNTCKVSMPCNQRNPRRKPVYWWNEDIAQIRKT